ncbi:MAG: (d)CMP kinase [Clostridiaceae bacterium]|nr:(d)CMP kinase [Clostridiaceae bacterium]
MFAIALDGPAGAGKSTIARKVAEHYGILYLDTGAMYRAMGWKAISIGIAPQNDHAVESMLCNTRLDVRFQNGEQRVFVDDKDVSDLIRTPEMSKAASDISALTCVRKHLVELQRQLAASRPLVIDGRDIGTYVLPDAPWKFFLTATAEERAQRRLLQLRSKGDDKTTLEEVVVDINYRDKQDSSREVAPLRQADDAILLDTTHLSIDQVITAIIREIGMLPQEVQAIADSTANSKSDVSGGDV